MLDSNQLDNDRGSRTFTDTGAPSHASLTNFNPLEAAVNAVKKYCTPTNCFMAQLCIG